MKKLINYKTQRVIECATVEFREFERCEVVGKPIFVSLPINKLIGEVDAPTIEDAGNNIVYGTFNPDNGVVICDGCGDWVYLFDVDGTCKLKARQI